MKKKLVSVIALVLVVCFVWVAEVDAVSVDLININEANLILSGVSHYYNSANLEWVSVPVQIFDESYTYIFCSPSATTYDSNSFDGLLDIFSSGDIVNLKILITFISFRGSDSILNVNKGVSFASSSLLSFDSLDQVVVDIKLDNITASYDAFLIDSSYTSTGTNVKYNFSYSFGYGSSGGYSSPVNTYFFGLLCEPVNYGLTNEEKQILQQILLGVDSANQQLDDMQSEQSSYYEDILQSEASDTDVIVEASSKREQFDEIMNEYSSLNADLARPGVDELLPDYSSVVSGFKDDDFNDVFDVFYGNSYIMFMLLASVFFATISFVIFGKKA